MRSLFRRTCRKVIRIGYAASNLATVGHTSLWQDILYDYGTLLPTFALTRHFDHNMIKPDWKCQNCSKKVIQGQIMPESIISRHFIKYWTIISHIRSNLTNLVSQSLNSVNWYSRPRSLNSALKWTNSIKLDIIDHAWPPLLTTDHTGPVNAILCSICH